MVIRNDMKIGLVVGGLALLLLLLIGYLALTPTDTTIAGVTPDGTTGRTAAADEDGVVIPDAATPPNATARPDRTAESTDPYSPAGGNQIAAVTPEGQSSPSNSDDATTAVASAPADDFWAQVYSPEPAQGDGVAGPVVERTPDPYGSATPATFGRGNLPPTMFATESNRPEDRQPETTPRPSVFGSTSQAATPADAPPQTGSPGTHTLAEGESFYKVAEQVYGDGDLYPVLVRANPTLDPSRLKPGTVLTVPPKPQASTSKPSAPAAAGFTPAPSAGPNQYRVEAGDTLSAISTKVYGTSTNWETIYDRNRDKIGDDPGALKVNMVLDLPR